MRFLFNFTWIFFFVSNSNPTHPPHSKQLQNVQVGLIHVCRFPLCLFKTSDPQENGIYIRYNYITAIPTEAIFAWIFYWNRNLPLYIFCLTTNKNCLQKKLQFSGKPKMKVGEPGTGFFRRQIHYFKIYSFTQRSIYIISSCC